MSLSFITLVNNALVQMNEVEISSADFLSTRGIQSAAKNAVRYAVQEVNQRSHQWPFNATEATVTLVKGQTVYNWAADHKDVDWNSFRLTADGTLLTGGISLQFIERDVYYDKYLIDDEDAASAGRGIPYYVAPSHTSAYLVSPSPDAGYTLKYRYWQTSPTLTADTDDTRIPDEFENVVVNGALVRLYEFKGDNEMAAKAEEKFERSLNQMRTLLINHYEAVVDTRVRY